MLLRGSWQGNGPFVEALLGRADATYRRPGGEGLEAGSAFSGSAGIAGRGRSAKVSYAICRDQPGFAPQTCLAGSEIMGIVLEQDLAAAGFAGVCRAEAEKRINLDPMGIRQQSGRCSASLKGKIGSLEAAGRVQVNEPGGIDLSLAGAFQDTGGSPRFSIESRLGRLSAGRPVLTLLAALELERQDARLSIEPGIEEWTVSSAAGEAIRHLRLKVSWSTRHTLGR